MQHSENNSDTRHSSVTYAETSADFEMPEASGDNNISENSFVEGNSEQAQDHDLTDALPTTSNSVNDTSRFN